MKAFSVEENRVEIGIKVQNYPFWRMLFGQSGTKNYSWIGVGFKDAEKIIEDKEIVYQINKKICCATGLIKKADILELKDNPDNFLLVRERVKEAGVLVFWVVKSGAKGTVNITPKNGAKIIKCRLDWLGNRKTCGTIAHCLAIIKPGQALQADITGISFSSPPFRFIKYDGQQLMPSYFYA